MKILASCLIGLALFAGCSGCSTARPLPASLETANQSAFPVVLAPYQCRIFRISGPGGPLDEGPWWLDAIGYQVFSAAFDGGKLPTDRLDYLTNAGFDLIWSTPIFKSPSTHGYDAVDYYKIKDSFGGDAAFTRYAAEAEKRGVRIVLDLVLNHCGVGHPWFADSAARRFGKDDWFVWTDKPEGPWKDNWGRGGFPWTKHEERGQFYYHWFGRGMPDLNVVNPVVRAELEKIGRYWLEKGAAGYRLDAVRHLVETGPGEEKQVSTPESVAWLADYQAALVANEPEAYTIGEVWDAKITDSGPLWYHDGKANS
jgi:glycosidase